ncbi:hypothetical protein L6452_31323 [Arctium lappa]|uniref:Uncharacterized protein n=1 Tax=Arctium lappa TaxID=4217 RepID=A0ACB8ZKK9_ARCLA|nr:hypothetical protein L6452_31323 [Arctium lappa]
MVNGRPCQCVDIIYKNRRRRLLTPPIKSSSTSIKKGKLHTTTPASLPRFISFHARPIFYLFFQGSCEAA